MPFLSNLKKPNNNNSIREAVISVFLANPIIKPRRFEQLISSSFADTFQHFEPLKAIKIQFRNADGKVTSFDQSDNEIGFKFTKYVNGKTSTILQGRNEEERNFISFHIFDYKRWQGFLDEFKYVLTNLSQGQSNLFVTAFSLHYIDEFVWENIDEPVPVQEIFDSESSILPKEFFRNIVNAYHLTSQKKADELDYYDRFEITVNPNPSGSTIFISHNITQPVPDAQELYDLVNSAQFLQMLQKAHEHNKDLLKSVLKEEVKEYIGLK